MNLIKPNLPFIDLKAQQSRIRDHLEKRIQNVLDHGAYIMGPEVRELEEKLASFCGAQHAITCANGTDALQLALMALGVGEGDAVIVPSFTFAATAEVVPLTGAVPVFADIELKRFSMAPESLERTIAHAKKEGLTPKAVIAVDLFGRLAFYDKILPITRKHKLHLITDAAQAFAAKDGEYVAGRVGDLATTSFFPAKPLGCYGDGGAVFTGDEKLADVLRSLRVHGKGSDKYDNVRVGLNSRLDSLQAAILLAKLSLYEEENQKRQAVAGRYQHGLRKELVTPEPGDKEFPVWAQYTIMLPDVADRAMIQARLKEAGVPSQIYYGKPLHLQKAYEAFLKDPQGLELSEEASMRVLSLPMHPYLEEKDQATIIETVNRALQ